eukprot:834164-Pyramimonas_sp.AAC.3
MKGYRGDVPLHETGQDGCACFVGRRNIDLVCHPVPSESIQVEPAATAHLFSSGMSAHIWEHLRGELNSEGVVREVLRVG